MKKGKMIIVAIAIVIMAGVWVCIHNQKGHVNESFFEQNLEALSQNETPTNILKCSTTSPIIFCGALCRSCNTAWFVPGISGQYVEGSSTCLCGATL